MYVYDVNALSLMLVEHYIRQKQGERSSGNDQHANKPETWTYGAGVVRRPPGLGQTDLVVQALTAGVGENVTCRPNRTLMVKTGIREPSGGQKNPH
jgi:hypothetical protein